MKRQEFRSLIRAIGLWALALVMAVIVTYAVLSFYASACALPGDGQGHGPALSYAASATTVLDNDTGLVWQRGTNYTVYPFAMASKWRLPTPMEAISIVDFGHRDPAQSPLFGPLADEHDGVIDSYWMNNTLTVDFNGGGVTTGTQLAYVRTLTGKANCLPNGADSYTDNGATITSRTTGLTWTKYVGVDLDWDDARASFPASLNAEAYGGYTDWRLPNVKELASLMEMQPISPLLNLQTTAFFWSSTPHAQEGGPVPTLSGAITCAWGVNGVGWVFHNDRASLHLARAVRGGTP